MKNLLFFFILSFTLGMVYSSCASSAGEATAQENSNKRKFIGEGQANRNLAEFLRKNTSITVEGTHPNVRLMIRGITTIKGDSRPFFIIDGVRMGRSYAQANNAVNLLNIKRINVLRGLSELAVYGEDGVNGVIIIDHYTE